MSKRARIRIMLAALVVILVLSHLMVWANTWPHHHGDPWITAGLLDVVVIFAATLAAVPPEWLP